MLFRSVALLLSVVAMPMAVAARGGTDRPVRAELTGSLTWDLFVEGAECDVVTKTESTGTMSHLGRVSASWRHCPLMDDSGGYEKGHVVFTGRHGSVEGVYEDADGMAPFVISVTGGTGRYWGASGTLRLIKFDAVGEWDDELQQPIEPWDWTGTIRGQLSY